MKLRRSSLLVVISVYIKNYFFAVTKYFRLNFSTRNIRVRYKQEIKGEKRENESRTRQNI